MRSRLTAAMLIAILGVAVNAAKIKSRAQGDPQFDFKTVKTWGWDTSGPGDVKTARSSQDDPKNIQKRIEPSIMDSVSKELAGIGLKDGGATPDVRFHYYLLITVGFSTQDRGQFLPAVPDWGVPPFTPGTSSFNIIQTGAIVLDAVSTKLGRVVWRAIGETEIDTDNTDDQHRARAREVIKDIVKRWPKK